MASTARHQGDSGSYGDLEHPAAHDHAYWARRHAITDTLAGLGPGDPIPLVDYLEDEHDVWRLVSTALRQRHRRRACREFLAASERLALPPDHVPQLRDVDERLAALTSFGLIPVGGLVPIREFYGTLADRRFCSTQYVRHHGAPFYTPEPDIVHELIGHAGMLADPELADLYQAAGKASRRATTPDALEFFSRVFWFTLEFGVVLEGGEPRAYGAGILSSCGEVEVFHRAEMRPFDLVAMGTTSYDITHYQPELFLAPSFAEMIDRLGTFFSGYDDERHAELTART